MLNFLGQLPSQLATKVDLAGRDWNRTMTEPRAGQAPAWIPPGRLPSSVIQRAGGSRLEN